MIAEKIFEESIRDAYYNVVDSFDGSVLDEAEYELEVKRRVYKHVNPANQKTAEVFNKLYDMMMG
jgi:hypothetical protein